MLLRDSRCRGYDGGRSSKVDVDISRYEEIDSVGRLGRYCVFVQTSQMVSRCESNKAPASTPELSISLAHDRVHLLVADREKAKPIG